ncbi:MAG TPA: DNA polymerase III subunit alpha [bacterium]|nr:DNA polymerase III subunit alpha [bacterium]
MIHSNFVHLHVHSYYSLLDGAAPTSELALRAAELKMPALAITDHGNLFGAIDFYDKISKHGVKPCIGCEVYLLSEGSRLIRDLNQKGALTHLTLLVKNREGYRNLCHLVSSSYLEGFYYKPRIDKEILRQHSKGLIALSGCLKGEIPQLISDGRMDEAEKAVDFYASLFDNNNFFIELMDHGIEGQLKIREGLCELAKRKGIGLVATNDVHYIDRSDAAAHDALLCIQTGKTLDDEKRMRLDSDQFYLKSPDEMSELFADFPEAISNTVEIAARLNMDFDFNTYYFPKYSPPDGMDLQSHLREEVIKGLEKRWTLISRGRDHLDDLKKVYQERLRTELETIIKMGFAGYFLIVADFIRYAKGIELPVGPGRGSAAGSLVAYCLEITNIDPIEHGLLFERFLNPERISMPDVDIDFCMRRRDEVISYVSKKYGNVSQIITFGTMKARAVVRDVGRVMGIPYGDVDRIAKLIPATLGMTLADAIKIEPKLKEIAKKQDEIARLLEVAKVLEGFPRHASTHAAGVVISDRPLSELVPLYKGQKDEIVTKFDMKCVEKVGLIKFDFLGLKTLTVIDDCVKLIEKGSGEKIDIESISLNDPLVYKKLSQGDTAGIFQLESSGMTDLVMKLKPGAFSEIVALVALFRPGPLGSGMVDDFINRKHGRTPIKYELPQLEEILKETYGVIVYQEQVMRIANVLANYSLGEADLLRRAMGKKKPEEMAKQHERFVKGALENKVPEAKAERLFELMAKFAEYGFNKSHSAAYALVAYQTAYLKFHHPTEFMAALLTAEKDNTDKVLFYINDCKTAGIRMLPPDVNESMMDFSVVGDGTIRFGLGAVKNVGEGAIENIVSARNDGGVFRTLFDFCDRIDSRRVNKRVIESLIKCGAFDFTKAPRAALLASLDTAMEMAASRQRDRISGQARLFDLLGSSDGFSSDPKLPDVSEWGERQLLAYEKESLGFYITGHPLAQYEELLSQYANTDTVELASCNDKQEVKLGGVVSKLREITTKQGNRMGFATIEDLKGSAEAVIFSDLYADVHLLIKSDQPVFVMGTADVDSENVKIIATQIMPIDEVSEKMTKSVHFFLSQPEVAPQHLAQLKNVLSRYPGQCPGFVHLVVPSKTETILALPDDLKLTPSPQLVTAVNKLFGRNVTKFIS